MEKSKTSIILLNWNNLSDLKECLNSLVRIDYLNYEIILVDNGSSDDSAEKIKKMFPQIIPIKNDENLGFAEGNNVGIRYAMAKGADYILLLNNDTVVEPDFLSILVRVAESDAEIGIVGPRIFFYDSKTLWFAGGILNRKTGFTYHLGEGRQDVDQFDKIIEADFISGCAMLIKKSVLMKIGFLDKDYFNSHEDADFCLRAKNAGFKILFEPKAVIYHKLARSMGGRKSPFYLYYRTRNHLLFRKKRYINAPFFWPIFLFLALKRTLGSLLLGQPKGALATIKGIYDYYAGNWGKGSGDKFR